VAEVIGNIDMFRGSPIESQAMRGVVPEERYNESTPELYKTLSNATGGALSPLQIQHLAEGYSGGLARDIVNTPGAVASGARGLSGLAGDIKSVATGEEQEQSFPLSSVPVAGRLFSRQDRTGKSVTDFYDQLKKDEQISKTLKAFLRDGKYDRASEYMEKYAEELGRLKMEQRIADQLRELKKVKDIKTATDLARYALGR
jgi:hypothetical protein